MSYMMNYLKNIGAIILYFIVVVVGLSIIIMLMVLPSQLWLEYGNIHYMWLYAIPFIVSILTWAWIITDDDSHNTNYEKVEK